MLQAPHIAESDDAAMTRIESRMKAAGARQRARLHSTSLKAPAAAAALDRFMGINDEIVALSRRNSNVRSLALSLGRKRMVTAECEDDLRALEEALAKHDSPPRGDGVDTTRSRDATRSRTDSRPTAR